METNNVVGNGIVDEIEAAPSAHTQESEIASVPDMGNAVRLLNMKQQVDDMRNMRKEIIDKQIDVLTNDQMSDHLDKAIQYRSLESIKCLTPEVIDSIYTMDGEPIVLDINMDSDQRAFEFKRDFLIYRKESGVAVAQIDNAIASMDQEMIEHEAELNALLEQFGDLSAFIRQKLVNDHESAETEQGKQKTKKMLACFDDALTLDVLVNHYTQFSTRNTIRDYHSRAEGIYEKYKKTMKLLNVRNDLTHFENLEIRFLPEKYHQYPNLFLFAVIKYFAYKSRSAERLTDGVFLTQFTVNIKNLFSNTFTNEETRETFIRSIQKVLDLFLEK